MEPMRDAKLSATPTPAQMKGNALAQAVEFLDATERQRLRALVVADMEIAHRLHADDFQLVNPAGRTLSKEEYLGGIASGLIDYHTFEPTSKIAVRIYAHVAVIRYQSRIEITAFGEEHSDRGWHTNVYELHDGCWQVAWSQMTVIQ